MLNFNGQLLSEDVAFLTHHNRGLRYGDSLFESFRAVEGKLIFWEDHYLRLMSSMRILRMEIPMQFTMEFLEKELLKTAAANKLETGAARFRLTIFRNDGGIYLPADRNVSYFIEAHPLESTSFFIGAGSYEVELFRDFYVNADMLSNLKTNNRIINVVGSIFAQENGYQNCLLLNNRSKQVVEALNANLFVVKDGLIRTPPLEDGCLNGIVRKKLMAILKELPDYEFEESSISPFELQKADELFLTNAVLGIRPITKYRKKEFGNSIGKNLVEKLNALAMNDQTSQA